MCASSENEDLMKEQKAASSFLGRRGHLHVTGLTIRASGVEFGKGSRIDCVAACRGARPYRVTICLFDGEFLLRVNG